MKTTQIQLGDTPSLGGAAHIEKAIRALPEVRAVKVELEVHRVTVEHDDADEAKLGAAIRATGMRCEIIPHDAAVLAPSVPQMN